MSWNEPEDDAKKNDPWSGKGRRAGNQAPPDLDEVVKNISKLSLIHISEPTRPY